MQNIVLFSIDISLDNLLTLLGFLGVYEILYLRKKWLWGTWLDQSPCFQETISFLNLKFTHTRSLLYTLSPYPFFSSDT